MTKLTIDQALQKGVAAHKAGQIQEADRLYTAILKAQPKHPDANHNMGVLAIGVGKVKQALPFLKTAAESNPSTAQFWLSYIVALIKLERLADAKAVLDQAKGEGPKGDGFDQLERKLTEAIKVQNKTHNGTPEENLEPPQDKQKSIINLYNKGQLQLALEQATILLQHFTNSIFLLSISGIIYKKLGQLDASIEAYNKALAIKPDYADAYYNMGITLKEQGKLDETIVAYKKALAIKPDYADAYNNMGLALKEQGKLEETIVAYKKALAIKPDYADAYNNMGLALKEQGKLEETIVAYKKALAIKPDYAEAYYNMGFALQEQGQLEEAIEAYNKALANKPGYAEAYNNMGVSLQGQGQLEEAIEAYNKALANKPDYAEAYNNMGVSLQGQGQLEEAIEAYNKALANKPDYADAIENKLTLAVQISPIKANYRYDLNNNEKPVKSKFALGPKYQILSAIKSYLEADFNQAHSYNNSFVACDHKLLDALRPEDTVFCDAYSWFLGKLLNETRVRMPPTENKIFHFGDSHCLSFAHRHITLKDLNFSIVPSVIFGAKAFHFSCKNYNSFKSITNSNFVSLPKSSKIFLSFGEIDCRPTEGFISASRKLSKPIENLVSDTVNGYVRWFLEQTAGQNHRLYFVNVPAPVYNKKYSADLNSEVARTVILFNAALRKYSLLHGFDVVDVFKFTVGGNGFSNKIFHVDQVHLGVKALHRIQQQFY